MLQGTLTMHRHILQKITVQIYNRQPVVQEKKLGEILWEVRIFKRTVYMEDLESQAFSQGKLHP